MSLFQFEWLAFSPSLSIGVSSTLIFFRIFRGHLHWILAGTFWLPANISQISSFSKADVLYINRREISRWFQKCITLYVYHVYFLTYNDFKAEMGPKLRFWEKRGSLQPWNRHKSRYTQDKNIKLYIFEISVKFRVDWCTMPKLLKNLKFGLY